MIRSNKMEIFAYYFHIKARFSITCFSIRKHENGPPITAYHNLICEYFVACYFFYFSILITCSHHQTAFKQITKNDFIIDIV